jgi:sec-independent protein translocase protein TatC
MLDPMIRMSLAGAKRIGVQMIDPMEGFFVTMKVAGIAGFLLASPFIFFFVWNFVAEGLYPKERKYVMKVVPFVAGLFLFGVLFFYFLVLPTALPFLMTFIDIPIVEMKVSLENYVSFFLLLSIMMGIVFEVPVVLIVLQKIGLVTPDHLTQYRRHAILAGVILAAVITPTGDPLTLALFTIPLIVLYEFSVWFGRRIVREKKKRERESDPGGDDPVS